MYLAWKEHLTYFLHYEVHFNIMIFFPLNSALCSVEHLIHRFILVVLLMLKQFWEANRALSTCLLFFFFANKVASYYDFANATIVVLDFFSLNIANKVGSYCK